MKTGITKNILFSVFLHGMALACCFALPAQKLVPLFCAGDSALTLTSLSVYRPGAAAPDTAPALREPPRAPPLIVPEKAAPEIEEQEEDEPRNLTIEKPRKTPAEKQPAAAPPSNVKEPRRRFEGEKPALFLNGDTRLKGIAGGLPADSGIRPYYPLGARMRGEEGIVKVEVQVDNEGGVLNCAVITSSGFPALDDAALSSVKKAHFVTARGEAPAENTRTVLTFRFDLTD